MAITLADYTNLSSAAVASSFTVPVPAATADGDLLIFSATTKENPWTLTPPHAGLIANSGGPAAFTDLIQFADGYSEVGSVRVAILGPDPGSLPRHFWWLGWKIAHSEPASYAINSLTGTSSGCQANILTFKGTSLSAPLGNQVSDPTIANSFPLPLFAINDRLGNPAPGPRFIAMADGSGNNTALLAYQLMLEGADGSEELYVFGNQSELPASRAVGGDAGTFGPPGLGTALSILQVVAGRENFFVLKLPEPVIATKGAVFRHRFKVRPGRSALEGFPFIPYGAVYVVNTTLPAGAEITVDFSHLSRFAYFEASLHEVTGMAHPVAASATPWGDDPFGGSTSVSAVASGGAVTVAAFSEAIPSPRAIALGLPPFYVVWKNTTGVFTKGGMRAYTMLAPGQRSLLWANPALAAPFGPADTQMGASRNVLGSAAWVLHDWGFGTDSFSIVFPNFVWNMTGSTVENNGESVVAEPALADGTTVKGGLSVVRGASTSVAPVDQGEVARARQYGGNILTLTLTREVTAPSALVFRGYALPQVEPADTDVAKYPHAMTDDVFGSANFMAGRAGESTHLPFVSF